MGGTGPGARTFSETFPGLDSQLLSWGGDAFNEGDIPGALETLDSLPEQRKASLGAGGSVGAVSEAGSRSASGATAPALSQGDRNVSGASQGTVVSSAQGSA